jgi:enoyl-CoA hydratase
MTATEELAGGTLQVTREGRICYVMLNRPHALNALTLSMYEALSELCQRLKTEPTVRVVVVRGAGGRALAAGTDIAEFTDFTSGEDGVRYERRIGAALQAIEDLPQVTIAVIEGLAVGGGLALATACDVRVSTYGSRIGYPIAATLGNALSLPTLRRCVQVFGEALVREMLLTARLVEVERAHHAGAVALVVDPAELEQETKALAERVSMLAPRTQQTTKRQLRAISSGADIDDGALLSDVYGSADFRGAVHAFVGRRREDYAFSAELTLP